MNETDEEFILRILDDNYDIDGHLIHKIEEPKKNSLPSSPKDDVIEIESLSQEDAAPKEEVQIKIQNSIEIKNDPPIIEENLQKSDSLDELFTDPHENHNQEEVQIQIQDETPKEDVQIEIQNSIEIENDPPKQEADSKKADSLDELFTNPHENHNQVEDKSDSDIEVENILSKKNKESDDQPEEIESRSKVDDNRAKLLAEKLRQKAKLNKPKKQLSFSFDFSGESSESGGLKIVVPQKKKRQLYREQMLEAHSRIIKEDINEAPNQEIQEEEYEIEEEEEEEKNEEIKNNEIAKSVIEELKKEDEDEDKENLTDEQLEHRLYERIVEMRLTEDLEEIKKIIRIITGQWRSGKLRFGDIADGLEKAFEGNEQERKELENKRMMRKQRKQKKNEEKTRKLTQESISQLIERAMWIKAGQDENASASDIIRGEMAKLSDNDPRKAIMERLEMDAFVQEERTKNALKERRISKNQMQKVERSSSGSKEYSFSNKIKFKSSQINHQHLFSFNLSKEKPVSKESTPSPKKTERKNKKVDKKFAEFLSKINK